MIRSICLTPEQHERFSREQRSLVSMLEGAREFGPKGVRCSRCWTYLPTDLPPHEVDHGCSTCRATDSWEPLPPLWPSAAVGFYAGCYVVVSPTNDAPGLDVLEGETITMALDRSIAEGR